VPQRVRMYSAAQGGNAAHFLAEPLKSGTVEVRWKTSGPSWSAWLPLARCALATCRAPLQDNWPEVTPGGFFVEGSADRPELWARSPLAGMLCEPVLGRRRPTTRTNRCCRQDLGRRGQKGVGPKSRSRARVRANRAAHCPHGNVERGRRKRGRKASPAESPPREGM
jgi:hypothetical protein